MIGTYVPIPDNLADKDLIGFYKRWRWFDDSYPPITMDFTKANFLSPWALALFTLNTLRLREIKRKTVKICIDEKSIAGAYIKRSGLIQVVNGLIAPAISDEDARTVPLTRIRTSSEIAGYSSQVMEVLNIDDEEISGAVKYSLVELLRNVVQHSQSDVGGLAMAQYQPKSGLVQMVVADAGVGIKSTLKETYPEIENDMKAVRFATMPHVSRTFAPSAYTAMKDNAGLGLFFIKEIISRSGGGFFLGSGRALVNIWGNEEGYQKKNYYESKYGWHGTFAVLQFRRDTIGNFDALLRRCRELAAEARKDPSELALDFLDEVPEIDGLKVIQVAVFEEDVEKAAQIRDSVILPSLMQGELVVLDFKGIKFATQSFVHALLYKLLREAKQAQQTLSMANCTNATREAIMAVAAYAKVENKT